MQSTITVAEAMPREIKENGEALGEADGMMVLLNTLSLDDILKHFRKESTDMLSSIF